MNADARYQRCELQVLLYEGAFANNPKDPGGATMKGITQRALEEWRGHACTVADVRNLTDPEIFAIYRAKYWRAVRGDDLFAGVDLICFDSAVNCGRNRAVRWLQHALGVAEDLVIGVGTLRALADASDAMVIEDIRQQREAFYRSLRTFATFGHGWMKRLDHVAVTATAMAEVRR